MPVMASGEKLRALLQHDAQFIVPVEILVGHGDEAEFGGFFAFDRLADLAL